MSKQINDGYPRMFCHCGSGLKVGRWDKFCAACEKDWRRAEEARRGEPYVWEVAEGDRFVRVRSFGRRPMSHAWEEGDEFGTSPEDEWWLETDGSYGGQEFIEVIEIVHTVTLGIVALYRQWIVDPDGADYVSPWASKPKVQLRAESRLRGILNSGKYQVVPAPKATPRRRRVKAAAVEGPTAA